MKKAKELRNRIKEYYKNKDLNTSVETIEVDMVRHLLNEHDQEIKDMIDEMVKIEEKARDEFDKEESSWAFIEGRIFILKQLRSKL